MTQRRKGRTTSLAALLLGTLALAAAASADTVVSKGTTLAGSVTALTNKGVTFAPAYGEGAIVIKWEDVEEISTDGEVMVLHGEEEDAVGPIRAKRDGFVVIGEREVEIATIHSGTSVGEGGPSWRDRVRSSWRYWDGNFDLGFNLQQSTTDTTGLVGAFGTTRTKGPSRFYAGAGYRYATEKRRGEPKSTTQDELRGFLRLEHDIFERVYLWGSGDLEYDGIERLSIRAVPKAGAGYFIFLEQLDEKRANFLKAEAGPGWVYQKYFGGDENDYFTVVFGARACYFLPYDAKFDWTFDYLPAVDDWADNYLLRTMGSLTFPLVDPVAAKLVISDEYNNQPSPGSSYNSLFLTIGLSIAW